jgi:hypothetical protein
MPLLLSRRRTRTRLFDSWWVSIEPGSEERAFDALALFISIQGGGKGKFGFWSPLAGSLAVDFCDLVALMSDRGRDKNLLLTQACASQRETPTWADILPHVPPPAPPSPRRFDGQEGASADRSVLFFGNWKAWMIIRRGEEVGSL